MKASANYFSSPDVSLLQTQTKYNYTRWPKMPTCWCYPQGERGARVFYSFCSHLAFCLRPYVLDFLAVALSVYNPIEWPPLVINSLRHPFTIFHSFHTPTCFLRPLNFALSPASTFSIFQSLTDLFLGLFTRSLIFTLSCQGPRTHRKRV